MALELEIKEAEIEQQNFEKIAEMAAQIFTAQKGEMPPKVCWQKSLNFLTFTKEQFWTVEQKTRDLYNKKAALDLVKDL